MTKAALSRRAPARPGLSSPGWPTHLREGSSHIWINCPRKEKWNKSGERQEKVRSHLAETPRAIFPAGKLDELPVFAHAGEFRNATIVLLTFIFSN